MLKHISINEMEKLLREAHPFWREDAIRRDAETYCATMDERLEAVLARFIATGEISDFSYGDFSVLKIWALCSECAFVDAVILMDGYLKDPVAGRAEILRR